MKKFLLISGLLISIFTSFPAWSIGFIEPALGIKTGSYKSEDNQFIINRDEGWARGGVLSIRGGYNGDLIFAGLELGVQILGMEADYDNTDSNAGFVGAMAGVLVGFHVPVLPFRIWAGVYGTGMGTSHEENQIIHTEDKRTFSGSAFKLGIGFRPLTLMSLNVEFCREMMNKRTREVTVVTTTSKTEDDLDPKPTITTAIFSISIPIEF